MSFSSSQTTHELWLPPQRLGRRLWKVVCSFRVDPRTFRYLVLVVVLVLGNLLRRQGETIQVVFLPSTSTRMNKENGT